jgi:predicted AlkP superfamily pyrophosphatase or phosphodiesterase
MLRTRWRTLGSILLVLLTVVVIVVVAKRLPGPAAPEKGQGHLAVLLVFDQMRGDYLSRWNDLFEKDGFRRLLDEGAWFQDCHYPYAETKTGPGHASLSTGCSPCTHGIIANEWFDREARSTKAIDKAAENGALAYCASLPQYKLVTLPPKEAKKASSKEGAGCPERLLVPTLADTLRVADTKGRIVSLSLKDRSAVLPGGKSPDACYWFDSDRGQFVTSSYYSFPFHPWVEELNRSHFADRWFGQEWERLLPALDYERYSGPDDGPGEGTGYKQGKTFPHPLDGGLKEPGKDYYDAIGASPYGNDLLWELTQKAIVAERLGQRDAADLLCVSFSSNDLAGHIWGPDSQEVLDITLRSDRLVRDLLRFLDERVGKGRYTIVLSADHGIVPLPEVSRQRGKDAMRIDPKELLKKAEAFLKEKYGGDTSAPEALQSEAREAFYFNPIWLRSVGKSADEVGEALAGWVKTQPGIQTAYTQKQLLGTVPEDDRIGRLVQRSFHSARSGDVIPIPAPYCFFAGSTYKTGTTHGAPYEYDTHVPLVVFGPGVKAGVRKDRVTPQAAAVVLARALSIDPPAKAEVTVPEGLFE